MQIEVYGYNLFLVLKNTELISCTNWPHVACLGCTLPLVLAGIGSSPPRDPESISGREWK